MFKKQLGVALAAVLVVSFISRPIVAQKVFLEEFKKVYPGLDSKFATCTICHGTAEKKEKPSKKNLNSYGKELQSSAEAKTAMGTDGKHKYTDDELKAVAAGIKAISGDKANSNGKTNEENIKAGVPPGVK